MSKQKNKTKVLIVGVDKYQDPSMNLNGCVNDAKNMYKLTQKFGAHPDNIRMLIDKRATQYNILKHLKWLIKDLKKDDSALFYNTSHGSQIRDKDGDEKYLDSLDECLIPHDHDWDNPLTDDKIADVLKDMNPEAHLTVIFDCCHSGTATRSIKIPLESVQKDEVEEKYKEAKVRGIDPPLDIRLRHEGRDLKLNKLYDYIQSIFGLDENNPQKKLENSKPLNHLFLSACKDHQLSYETKIDGEYGGIFTYFLAKEIKNHPNADMKDIIDKVSKDIDRYGFDQSPQIEGVNSLQKMSFLK